MMQPFWPDLQASSQRWLSQKLRFTAAPATSFFRKLPNCWNWYMGSCGTPSLQTTRERSRSVDERCRCLPGPMATSGAHAKLFHRAVCAFYAGCCGQVSQVSARSCCSVQQTEFAEILAVKWIIEEFKSV